MSRHCTQHLLAGTERLSVQQWADRTGLTVWAIRARLKRGWTPEQAVGATAAPETRPGPKTRLSKHPDYQRRQNAARRQRATILGLCTECVTDQAAPDRTKCHDCLTINRLRKAA